METEMQILRRPKFWGNAPYAGLPLVSVRVKSGTMVINKAGAMAIKLNDGGAVMFGFSKAKRVGYIWLEQPQEDSYYFKRYKGQLRLTCGALRDSMVDVFRLADFKENVVHFEINPTPNEKKAHEFTLKIL